MNYSNVLWTSLMKDLRKSFGDRYMFKRMWSERLGDGVWVETKESAQEKYGHLDEDFWLVQWGDDFAELYDAINDKIEEIEGVEL